MKLYAIYDRLAESYGNVMEFTTDGVAIRTLSQEVNRQDERNNLYLHPQDFMLYQLGEYDQTTGKIAGEPRMVVSCNSLVQHDLKQPQSEVN